MLNLLRKIWRREPPLIRTGTTGRPRTYSAESGYVYTYSFSGFRRIRKDKDQYVEYVFEVSGAREQPVPVTVALAETRLGEWTGTNRELTASERYGIAKICLKQALDRFENPASLEARVAPGRDEIREVARVLDL